MKCKLFVLNVHVLIPLLCCFNFLLFRVFSFCLLTVSHSWESSTVVSAWPGWSSSQSLHRTINSLTYPSCGLSSQAPCCCGGCPACPCCGWTGLWAAGLSPPPGLRAWKVASRETAETSGPTSSSSWLMTRMLSWVRLALFRCFSVPYLL